MLALILILSFLTWFFKSITIRALFECHSAPKLIASSLVSQWSDYMNSGRAAVTGSLTDVLRSWNTPDGTLSKCYVSSSCFLLDRASVSFAEITVTLANSSGCSARPPIAGQSGRTCKQVRLWAFLYFCIELSHNVIK